MSTITKEFTKEQLIERLRHGIAVAAKYPDLEQAQLDAAIFKIALASLEAEPVAYIFKHPAGRLFWSLTDESNKGQSDVMPVYTAQPAPVFVPDELTREEYKRRFMEDDDFDDTFRGGWKAHRAAMLQGADGNSPAQSGFRPAQNCIPPAQCGNSPVIPGEVLSAVRKVACIRADFDGFDGDRRDIGDCLDEAEQELIVTINKYASVIAAAPQEEVK